MRFILLIWILFKSASLGIGYRNQLIVWNVGQGSWATAIRSFDCLHFDMGGEWAPKGNRLDRCRNVQNYLFVSHMDWDHISNISRWNRRARQTCLAKQPRDWALAKQSKRRVLMSLRKCQKPIMGPEEVEFQIRAKKPNPLSRVFHFKNFLFPGDSTRGAEKIWAPLVRSKRIEYLILGHHGSRTSTSKRLVHDLEHLDAAIASARRRRYGHPHAQIAAHLARQKIPLLTTEKWGHLIFEY